MTDLLSVSSCGQVTLPAELRRQLGTPGSTLAVKAVDGALRLKPVAVVEPETYSDEQVAAWDREDELSPAERKRILQRLQRA